MRHVKYIVKRLYIVMIFFLVTGYSVQAGFVVDHTNTNLDDIPDEWITSAKENIHAVYNHTSHGSQLITGLNALKQFPSFGTTYAWTDSTTGTTDSLSLDDRGMPAPPDLSQGDQDSDGDGIADWAETTYTYLDNPNNYNVNVVMWSWCNISGHDIDRYIRSMEWLIAQFSTGGSTYTDSVMTTPASPHSRTAQHPVQFVFMTAHANGGGEGDSSDLPNTQIRNHVENYNRILFDFSDIENFDPDDTTGTPDPSVNSHYYLDKRLTDALFYDNTSPYDSGNRDANWASEYLVLHDNSELDQLTHGEGVAGYNGAGSCAHSDGPNNDARLNCVLKGRATWYLFARLAGWNGLVNDSTPPVRSNGHPTGTLSIGTTSVNLTLDTDENSTCKYDTSPGVAYNSMSNTFATTGNTSHSTSITGLNNGSTYTYYVRCKDSNNNANTDDFVITFSVASNNAPTDITLSSNSIDENQPTNTVVGTLSTTDSDTGDSHTYSLSCNTAGADDSSFNINSNELRSSVVFDYETKNSYAICIKTDDGNGGTFDKNFTISINDVIENVTPPTLAEVTPVSTPTTDTTPDYTFSSTEAGTITYGGDCSSSMANATVGNNTITFNTLSNGTHSNCTIVVTDTAGNASATLNITSFEVIAPTCTSFTYSSWGDCQPNNTRSRTIITSSPNGCVGGSPVFSETCTYVPPAISSEFNHNVSGPKVKHSKFKKKIKKIREFM